MRLAFLIEHIHPYGGRQRFMQRLVDELRARGHDSRVYTLSWQGCRPAGLDVCIVPARGLRQYRRSQSFQQWVMRDIRDRPVDAVVGMHPMPGLDACFAFDRCFLETAERDRSAWFRRSASYRYTLSCERSVFSPPSQTQVFLHTEAQGKAFVQRYGTEAERLTVLPPAVSADRVVTDDAAARRARTRATFGLDAREITLLFLGAPFAQKGLGRALRSLASLRNSVPNAETRLLVAGPERPASHQSLARRLGVADAVDFLGPRDDIPDLLLAADVLVHPAVSEAGGLVVLEAMAAGLPVLTTAATGHAARVAQAGAGIVLREPFAQRAMGEALHAFLESDYRRECAEAGLAYAQREDLYSGCSVAADRLVAHLTAHR